MCDPISLQHKYMLIHSCFFIHFVPATIPIHSLSLDGKSVRCEKLTWKINKSTDKHAGAMPDVPWERVNCMRFCDPVLCGLEIRPASSETENNNNLLPFVFYSWNAITLLVYNSSLLWSSSGKTLAWVGRGLVLIMQDCSNEWLFCETHQHVWCHLHFILNNGVARKWEHAEP